MTAFDCVREHCPAYFNNVWVPVAGVSGRANLHWAERHDMIVPSTRTQLGRQSFHVAAPTVWNELPLHLRSSSISRGQFRAGLKTISLQGPTRTPLRTFVEERIILHLRLNFSSTQAWNLWHHSSVAPSSLLALQRVSVKRCLGLATSQTGLASDTHNPASSSIFQGFHQPQKSGNVFVVMEK